MIVFMQMIVGLLVSAFPAAIASWMLLTSLHEVESVSITQNQEQGEPITCRHCLRVEPASRTPRIA